MPGAPDPLYVRARRALLDATDERAETTSRIEDNAGEQTDCDCLIGRRQRPRDWWGLGGCALIMGVCSRRVQS